MTPLKPEQQRRALELMHEWLSAPADEEGQTPLERQKQLDLDRASLIDETLAPLVRGYLDNSIPLDDFKTKVDSINKRHEYWGFKGIKGQMFFNMLVNVADSPEECEAELKAAIAEPANDEMAKSRIKTFASYVKRLGEQHVDSGGTKQGRPNLGSIPLFLSYFWQVQNRFAWPVYYTNSVQVMVDSNLWAPQDDIAADYVDYKHRYEELAELFSRDAGRPFSLYDVEHVFWVKGGNPYGKAKPQPTTTSAVTSVPTAPDSPTVVQDAIDRLPESYVPPIVDILPRLALGGLEIEAAAIASGASVARAFEKSVHAAFTILGYETKLLGQGSGRMPDGLALDFDDSYAIIWDAKSRAAGYSMGTDDRAIREYVAVQSRELRRRRMLRNTYYVIVSSSFKDEADETIRSVKMDTDISEVCLMEAAALVAMVDAKLRDPLGISLGPDGLQRLLGDSGIMAAETVIDLLG